MRALMYTGIRQLEVQELPEPAGDFVVGVLGCAICGTDLKTYLQGHPKFKPPMILGHEFIGRVLRAPEGCGFSADDIVNVAPYGECGVCGLCRRGAGELCSNKDYSPTGSFCEMVEIPLQFAARGLIKMDTPDFAYVLSEPLACVLCALEMLDITDDSRALIIGGGPMGALFAEALSGRGVPVSISEINPLRAGRLKGWGFDVRAPGDVNYGEYDNIVVAVNKPELVGDAVRDIADCGTVHMFSGMPASSMIDVSAYSIHYRKVRLVGCSGFALRHFSAAHDIIKADPGRYRKLITHYFKMEEGAGAFELLSEGNAFKVLIQP